MSASASDWSRQHERGNAWLTRLMAWLILRLGWSAGQLLLLPVTAWFIAASGSARAASRGFLGRVLGRRASFLDVSRHFLSFANVTFDRLFLLTGRTASYRFEVEGLDRLRATLDRGRGCVLLGCHLGSFEALRAIAADCPRRIRPMMYRANAAEPTRLLERLNPALARDIIELGTLGAMLEARESVARGEIVGMLADRAHRGEKSVAIDFFGSPALFPAGPILLAGALEAPVFLCFAPRLGPRHYRILIEPFCDGMRLRDGGRDAVTQLWLKKYVARLEHHCRAHPFNWFNFFDFWSASAKVGNPTRRVEGLASAAGVRSAHFDDGAAVLARDADAGIGLGAPAP